MVVATDRRLYVSTDKGLFQARSNGRGYEAQSLAFDRYAPMRWPVVVDCDNPRRLYAGTSKGGMFRSDDAGQNWREINQGIIYKEIWSLAQHPRTGELYVGTGPASVFKSLDRGESWIDSEQFRTMPESIDWTFPPASAADVMGTGRKVARTATGCRSPGPRSKSRRSSRAC